MIDRRPHPTRWLAPLAAGFFVLAGVSSALAQEQAPPPSDDIRPPAPGTPEKPITAAIYVLGFALAIVAIGATIMPSQRSHQD